MAEIQTIARPYAKAAFQFAREKQALPEWLTMLNGLANVAGDTNIQVLLSNPKVTNEQVASVFIDVLANQLDENARNFVNVLGQAGRLTALPSIFTVFKELYEEEMRVITANVYVAQSLTDEQQAKLQQALEQRLNQKVEINTIIDPSVYGGVRVEANDMVIDGTIRGRLHRLFENLHVNA